MNPEARIHPEAAVKAVSPEARIPREAAAKAESPEARTHREAAKEETILSLPLIPLCHLRLQISAAPYRYAAIPS